MLKNMSKLECKIGERIYQFILEMDSPLHDVKECLFQFQKYVGQVEDTVKSQLAAQVPEVSSTDSKVESIEQPKEG